MVIHIASEVFRESRGRHGGSPSRAHSESQGYRGGYEQSGAVSDDIRHGTAVYPLIYEFCHYERYQDLKYDFSHHQYGSQDGLFLVFTHM